MFDDMVHVAHDLNDLGYHLHATDSTHDFLADKGVKSTLVRFPGAHASEVRRDEVGTGFCRTDGTWLGPLKLSDNSRFTRHFPETIETVISWR